VVVVIRGSGDIGSAVGHRLFTAGYGVILHESPHPTATRRGMAFTDAIFDGRAVLEGVVAIRVDDLQALPALLAARTMLPVVVTDDVSSLLRVMSPEVLIDARLRKRLHPEVQRRLAPLTMGLGPNFTAGVTTDLIVETSWGPDLGKVLNHGATQPLAGEPRPLAGVARARYVYAPVAGVFRTALQIGSPVRAGAPVAYVGATVLTAPLDGVLRGLTHDGVPVTVGTKVIEVDPRGPAAVVRGMSERPGTIAEGVLRAVQAWVEQRARQTG
jgi:xanthine dehydrogenase accessory factor